MNLQNLIGTLSLAGIVLVALVFVWVVSQASRPADGNSGRLAPRLQAVWFVVLLLVFAGATWATLRQFPIPPQQQALHADQVVTVTGRMWLWELEPATLRAGSPVEFRVTSVDVNHGFGIYAPDGHMVTQTQAMPGYVNRILHTFDVPGTYTVHCLEYCGIGHAPMKTSFEVLTADAPRGD